ncbi:MAG: DoxX family protein [Saprospiraceae bacterium]
MKNILDLIGRIFISFIFFFWAYDNISNPTTTKEMMVEYGLTYKTHSLFMTGVILMVLGSLSVLTGYRAKLGATFLALFLIPSTIYYSDLNNEIDQEFLVRNFAIAGGLMMIMANGSGRFSIKKIFAGIR